MPRPSLFFREGVDKSVSLCDNGITSKRSHNEWCTMFYTLNPELNPSEELLDIVSWLFDAYCDNEHEACPHPEVYAALTSKEIATIRKHFAESVCSLRDVAAYIAVERYALTNPRARRIDPALDALRKARQSNT